MRLWFKRLLCRHTWKHVYWNKGYYDMETWLQCIKCGKQTYEDKE